MVQKIYLIKDPHNFATLEMLLCTSVRPNWVYLKQLSQDDPRCQIRYREYKNNDEFVAVLNEYADLVVAYGLDLFNKISIPEFLLSPTREMYVELYENHAALAASFMKNHNIGEDVTAEEAMGLVIKIIKENDERNGGKRFDDSQRRLLLEAAAYYSEKIVRQFEGNWYIGVRACLICDLKCKLSLSMNVLGVFSWNWETDEYNILEGYHKEMFDGWRELHSAKEPDMFCRKRAPKKQDK